MNPDSRLALLEAAMIEDVVARMKAINDWCDRWLVTVQQMAVITPKEMLAAVSPQKLIDVHNAAVFHAMLKILILDGREQGVLQITDQGKDPKTGDHRYMTQVRLVRFR